MYKVNIIIGAAYKINKKHIFSLRLQSDPQKSHSIGRAVLKVRSYGANIPFKEELPYIGLFPGKRLI